MASWHPGAVATQAKFLAYHPAESPWLLTCKITYLPTLKLTSSLNIIDPWITVLRCLLSFQISNHLGLGAFSSKSATCERHPTPGWSPVWPSHWPHPRSNAVQVSHKVRKTNALRRAIIDFWPITWHLTKAAVLQGPMLPRMSEVSPWKCRVWRDWPNSNFTNATTTKSGGGYMNFSQNKVPQHPMGCKLYPPFSPVKFELGYYRYGFTPCLDIQFISTFQPPSKIIYSTPGFWWSNPVKSLFWLCLVSFSFVLCLAGIIMHEQELHFKIVASLVFNGIWICLAGYVTWNVLMSCAWGTQNIKLHQIPFITSKSMFFMVKSMVFHGKS